MQQTKVGCAYGFALLAILAGIACLGFVLFDAGYPDGARRGIAAALYDWPLLLLGGVMIAVGLGLIAEAGTTTGEGG